MNKRSSKMGTLEGFPNPPAKGAAAPTRLIWLILGCGLLVVGFAECDMGTGTTSALNSTTCDAGPDATCTFTPPPSPPSGGW